MALTIRTFCLAIAVVLFVAAALYVPPSPPRFNLVAAGLTFLALSMLFP